MTKPSPHHAVECPSRRGFGRGPWLVLLVVTGLFVVTVSAGCGSSQESDSSFVLFDMREYATADGDSGSRPADDLRLTSRQRAYLGGEALRVEAFTSWTGAGGEIEDVRTVRVWDYERRRVWTAAEGGEFSSRSYDALDHEAENRWRGALVDLWDAYLASASVRAMPDIHFFFGDGRRLDSGIIEFAGQRLFRRRFAVEPGVYWDAAVLTYDAFPFVDDAARIDFLVGVLGVAPGRAPLVLRRLGGVPLLVDVHYFSAEGDRPVVEGELFDLGPGEPDPGARWPDLDAAEDGAALDAAAILARVSELDGVSTPETAIEWFLMLSERLDADSLGPAVQLLGSSDDPWVRIELARAVLRYDPDAGRRALERFLRPSSGFLALDVVEALIAEEHPDALVAIVGLLRRRDDLPGLSPPEVARWGVRHLRALSGMSIARVLEQFPPGAAPGSDAELERWLEWFEERNGAPGS